MADISAVITLHDQITKELHTIGVTIANTQNKLTNFKKMIEEPMASKLSDGLGKGVEKTKRLNEEIKNTRTTTETVSKSTKTVGDKISENTKKQKNFNQQLRESGKETRQLSRNIKGIIGAYASFSALRSGASLFADTSDGLTSLYARMALVNDGTHTQDEFKKEIFDAARRSRSNPLDIGTMATKLNFLADNAFKTNDEALMFAETMKKHFIVGGNDDMGAQYALLQATQALSSGVLRGDEFRSIAEQAPTAVKSIADYLGVSRGEVRLLAYDGKITADIFKNAILASTKEINTQLKQMPITWSQFKTRLKTEAIEAFSPLASKFSAFLNSDKGEEFMNALITGIYGLADATEKLFQITVNTTIFLKNNWDALRPIFKLLGILVGVWLAGKFIKFGVSAVSSIVSIGRALMPLLTNPAFLFVSAFITGTIIGLRMMGVSWQDMAGMAVGAVAYMGSQIGNAFRIVGNIIIFVQNLFGVTINLILGGITIIHNAIAKVWNKFADLSSVWRKMQGLDPLPDKKMELWEYKSFYKDKEYIPLSNPIDAYKNARNTTKDFFNKTSQIYNNAKNFNPNQTPQGWDNILKGVNDGIGKDINDIKGNTKKIANKLDVPDNDLSYLSALAEKRTMQYITQHYKIDMKTDVKGGLGDADIDGYMYDFVKKFKDITKNSKTFVIPQGV
jgi:hypothetical protein